MDAFEIRLVDDVMYGRSGKCRADFVALRLDDPNNFVGMVVAQMDLRSVLDHLEDDRGILTAVYVGQEDVDGEELDHYTVMVRTPIMIRYLRARVAGSAAADPRLRVVSRR